jgi:hypothetical protein
VVGVPGQPGGCYLLQDALLVWSDASLTSSGIKAWDGSTTYTVSTDPNAQLLATTGGNVVFLSGNQLYVWSAGKSATLLLPGIPGFSGSGTAGAAGNYLSASGNVLTFVTGIPNRVYTVPLQ